METNFIFINVVLLFFLFFGYLYISHEETKSMFACDMLSGIWFSFITPVLGVIVNVVAYLTTKNILYLLMGLAYLLFYIFKILSVYITEKKDVTYYRKNLPILKNKLDLYLNSVNSKLIDGYNIVLSRNADYNMVILKIREGIGFNNEEYIIHKNEIENILSEYKIRVSYE